MEARLQLSTKSMYKRQSFTTTLAMFKTKKLGWIVWLILPQTGQKLIRKVRTDAKSHFIILSVVFTRNLYELKKQLWKCLWTSRTVAIPEYQSKSITQSEINHLSLEALLPVLHDVKVFQVQLDLVTFLTLCRGHVPHHDEGPVLQDRCCCSHGLWGVGDSNFMGGVLSTACSWGGTMGEGISTGGGLWHRSAGDEREEEEENREVRQHHGCSETDVSFLTGERNGPVKIWLMRNFSELGYRLLSRIKVDINWSFELSCQNFFKCKLIKLKWEKVKGIFYENYLY